MPLVSVGACGAKNSRLEGILGSGDDSSPVCKGARMVECIEHNCLKCLYDQVFRPVLALDLANSWSFTKEASDFASWQIDGLGAAGKETPLA